MAEIQGGVVAADINDDGKIELVTVDTHGNVAAWTVQGEEIWERHVKSLIPQVTAEPQCLVNGKLFVMFYVYWHVGQKFSIYLQILCCHCH